MVDHVRGAGQPPGWYVAWESGGAPHRLAITGELTVGRSVAMDIVIEDPYVSRRHCVLALRDGVPWIDASQSLNGVRVRGSTVKEARLEPDDVILIGGTQLTVTRDRADARSTLLMPTGSTLRLRLSTHELLDASANVIATLTPLECSMLELLAARYPDAASHDDIGTALWGPGNYDRYLIHRLAQRLRDVLDDNHGMLENVRGSGYRLRSAVRVV